MYYLADPDVPEEEVADHPITVIGRFEFDVPTGSPLFRVRDAVVNEGFSELWYAFWQIPQVIPEDG
jgi:hypothetical protein